MMRRRVTVCQYVIVALSKFALYLRNLSATDIDQPETKARDQPMFQNGQGPSVCMEPLVELIRALG